VTVSGHSGAYEPFATRNKRSRLIPAVLAQAVEVTSGPGLDETHGAATVPHGTASDGAGGRRPALGHGERRSLRRPPWSLIAGPAVTLALMLWGITAPAYWGDEADTVSAVSRSLPQLLRMLRHVDAVHGLYYLLLWPVVRVLGPGELATRLPSAIAMAAAALGIAAIARRLASGRAALYAGLVFAVFPIISAQAHDARPEGMVTAAAVLASYLLVRAAGDPHRGWFAAYGVSLVLLAYLELFGLLLIPAHAITVAALHRRGIVPRQRRGDRAGDGPGPAAGALSAGEGAPGTAPWGLLVRRWLIAVAAAVAAVVPLVAYGWQQRAQIAWIAKPSWHDVLSAIVSMAAGSALAGVIALLVIMGGILGGTPAPPRRAGPGRLTGLWSRAGGRDRRLTWLALPWLVLPPAMLLAASEIEPAYSFRYLVFCLPGTALLAGAGLAALGWAMRAVVLALMVALIAPTQLSMRAPGAGMRAVSQFLAARERRGDAVIYPGSGVPPWYLAYPNGLGRLRDIWMAESGPASGRLYGVRVSLPVLETRERGVCRVWAAEMSPPWISPAQYLPGFRLAHAWQPQPGVRLWLFTRPSCAAAPGTGR
jgi:mannosyltransferase